MTEQQRTIKQNIVFEGIASIPAKKSVWKFALHLPIMATNFSALI